MDMISKRKSQDDINICNTRAGIEDDVRRPGILYSKINGIGSLPSIPTCSNRSSKCKMLFHRLEQTDFKSPESCSSLEAAELCLIANEVHSKLYSCVSRVSLHSHENQQYHSWPKQKQTWKKFNRSPYHNFGLDTAVDKNQKQARRLCEKNKDVLNAEKLVRIESVKNNNIDRYVSVAVQDSNISGKRDMREYLLDEAEKFLPGTVSNCMTSDEYYQRACLEKRKSEFESVYDAMIENLQQIDSALKISQTSYMSNDQTSSQQEQFSESKQKFEHTSHWICDDKFIENVDSIVCSDITENLSSSSFEDSGSDSGLGQYSDFNPILFSSNGISPPLFKKRKDLMMQWFASFSNEQKNIFLQQTIATCGLPQMHMLSLKLEPVLHKNCPQNCCDMLQWLPEVVVYCILEYLDPVSLSSASIVNRTWYSFSQHQLLWQRFCSYHDYSLSSARHCEQMKKHTMPDGIINWRNVFVERYLCKRNWRKGKCKVKTFVGHTQGVKFNSLTYVSIPGVSCVQFDNKRIVSGSSDKTIRVWDLTSDSTEPVLTLVGHFGTVRCLQLRGNRVVSGSADATIKVWDLSVGSDWNMATCRVTMVGHLDTVRCLQVDEDKVISGSYDNTLKVWDVTTGRCKLTLRGHNAGVLCVQFDDQKIVSGSSDNTIKCIGTIDWIRSEGHTRVVRCLQADHWKIVSAGDDKTLKIWCLKTRERFVTLPQHTDGMTCLQFDDVMIVSGSYDKTVKVWNFLP